MKILYICRHNPFGLTGGGDMASHAFFRSFADIAKGEIDLICSDKRKAESDPNIQIKNIYYAPKRNLVSRLLSPITGYRNRFISFTKELLIQSSTKYDTIVFDHNDIAGPLVKYANKLGLRTITIHHNYEKEYFADNYHGITKMIFLKHVIKWERLAYQNSDLNLFLTSYDMNTFQKVYGRGYGNSYVLGTFEYHNNNPMEIRHKDQSNSITFAITGSLSSFQTQDAICYFFNELYSCLPANSKLIIAGRNPNDEIIALCNKYSNVELIPNPVDMNAVICSADIYLCATRIGGGLKLRVMDGLKLGLPVITHTCSARGFDAFFQESCFKQFTTPQEFRECVNSTIVGLRNGLFDRQTVQNIYINNFSYQAGYNRLKKIINQI